MSKHEGHLLYVVTSGRRTSQPHAIYCSIWVLMSTQSQIISPCNSIPHTLCHIPPAILTSLGNHFDSRAWGSEFWHYRKRVKNHMYDQYMGHRWYRGYARAPGRWGYPCYRKIMLLHYIYSIGACWHYWLKAYLRTKTLCEISCCNGEIVAAYWMKSHLKILSNACIDIQKSS